MPSEAISLKNKSNTFTIMKKNLLPLLITILTVSNVFCQVGINTTNPQGILHMKNVTKKLGVVMPIVDSAPSTVTPAGAVPVEATVVYDSIKQCLRLNTSAGWSDCLLDKSTVEGLISTSVLGDRFWMVSKYSSTTSPLMQKRFDYSYYTSAFNSITDKNFLTGAGYTSYGLGLSPAGTQSPATRLMAKSALTTNSGLESRTVITTSGDIFVTGSNYGGKLGTGGNGDVISSWTKVTIAGLAAGENPIQVQQSAYNTIILTNLGNVYAAGENARGQTGLGTTVGNTLTYTKIPTLSNIKSIWSEQERTPYNMFTAIDATGKVFAWGYNFYAGPWGATATFISTPQDITSFFAPATASGAKVVKVMIGYYSLIALMDNNTLWGSVAQGFPLYRIGKGNANATNSNLMLLSDSISLASGETIVDFDMDMDGAVVITNHFIWYTGFSYGYRFGNGGVGQSVNWTLHSTSLLDGDVTLTAVDMGYYGVMIATGSGVTEGGSRLLVAGYNGFKSLGTTPATGDVQNLTYATY
ncbi:conserved protein of unknown function [Chryseobacterium sp. JV274]|nr:conserved protein of unknown function [Chryseobacterium sp. JV274]